MIELTPQNYLINMIYKMTFPAMNLYHQQRNRPGTILPGQLI